MHQRFHDLKHCPSRQVEIAPSNLRPMLLQQITHPAENACIGRAPILEKKPGALRHGVPFVQWALPSAIQQVRDRLLKHPKGDRAFVELLLMAREAGLEVLQVACELALEHGG